MATTSCTRAEQIDRYVELAALEQIMTGGTVDGGPFQALIKLHDLDNLSTSLSGALFDEVWPADADGRKWSEPETDEFNDALIRSQLLAAKLFAVLAEHAPKEVVQCVEFVEYRRALRAA
jgi:hypothetical protein